MLLFIMIFTNIGHKVQGEGAGGGGGGWEKLSFYEVLFYVILLLFTGDGSFHF